MKEINSAELCPECDTTIDSKHGQFIYRSGLCSFYHEKCYELVIFRKTKYHIRAQIDKLLGGLNEN